MVQRVTTSGTASDNEWYNEWQRVDGTTNDNEWQRVVQQVTMNDSEWQRMVTSNKKWQWVAANASGW